MTESLQSCLGCQPASPTGTIRVRSESRSESPVAFEGWGAGGSSGLHRGASGSHVAVRNTKEPDTYRYCVGEHFLSPLIAS